MRNLKITHSQVIGYSSEQFRKDFSNLVENERKKFKSISHKRKAANEDWMNHRFGSFSKI